MENLKFPLDSKAMGQKGLYIITPIFNPAGFKRRYDLYYQFEAHMRNSGINLITIECIFENETEYSVTDANNPFHIQVKTNHPLWIKENLINLAIKRLPSDWKYVLWLDADIEFLEEKWPQLIIEAFVNYDILQVFKHAHFLGPEGNTLETHFSLTYAVVHDLPIAKKYYNLFYPHPGYGWGITRKAFDELNGLIDFGILGSGDAHMAFALLNRVYESIIFPQEHFTKNYLTRLRNWQEKANKFIGRVGYADCVIKHYFHGYREDRGYINRMKILINHSYDPINDIEYDSNGLIQIKEKSLMREEIKNYFTSRKEDTKKEKADEKNTSAHLKLKTLEEILKNALLVKNIVERESFRNALKNIHENRNTKPTLKRSKSLNSSEILRRNRNLHNRDNGKKIEMFYLYEINFNNVNNILHKSSSCNSSSTEENDSNNSDNSLFGLNSDNNQLSPSRSFTYSGNNYDRFMNKYGACCSTASESNKAKRNNNQNGNNNQAQRNNYQNPNNYDHTNKNFNEAPNFNNNNPNNFGNNNQVNYNNGVVNQNLKNQKNKNDKKEKEKKKKQNNNHNHYNNYPDYYVDDDGHHHNHGLDQNVEPEFYDNNYY